LPGNDGVRAVLTKWQCETDRRENLSWAPLGRYATGQQLPSGLRPISLPPPLKSRPQPDQGDGIGLVPKAPKTLPRKRLSLIPAAKASSADSEVSSGQSISLLIVSNQISASTFG